MSAKSLGGNQGLLHVQTTEHLAPGQLDIGILRDQPAEGLLECGVDEVGIGSAIAEVYAAACILDPVRRINGLRDSKQLTPERRQQLSDRIKGRALDFCIATASLEEVNQLNVFGATMLAMQRAVAGLKLKPGIVLIDGNRMPQLPFPARTIVKGDAKVRVISAASMLAKVARDEAMLKYHEQFPQYGFASNKGYLTEFHLATLKQFGPCPIHRQNYEPVKLLLSSGAREKQLAFFGAATDEEFESIRAAERALNESTGAEETGSGCL